ncbi:MAG: EcsC family protein [Dyella sp.]
MSTDLTESKIRQALEWAYEKAMDGIPGTGTARELAEDYRKNSATPLDAANSLIRWQNTKAATAGFLAGLGGLITLPVAITANVASVMYVQLRMITAIAYLGGHDPKEDRVKALAFACLTGNAAVDILKDAGIAVVGKVAINSVKGISGATLLKINKAVGFRLLTKFGSTGIINLGKAVPILGGLVGGAFDSVTTNTVGNFTRNLFISEAGVEQKSSKQPSTVVEIVTKPKVIAKNSSAGVATRETPAKAAKKAVKRSGVATKNSLNGKTAKPPKKPAKKGNPPTN